MMSGMVSAPSGPVYELDSVSEDKLEALILQLGLKKHSKTSMDPCCVICRQNAFWSRQARAQRPHTESECASNNNPCARKK